MANRDLLLIGTSAGGVNALRSLVGGLPADLPACVLVVMHLSGNFPSSLDEILSQAGKLPASFARDGEPIRRSRIYIGAPECHLLLNGDGRSLRLGSGPRENNSRPAIDPLFRSAAMGHGHRSVGVVMTGLLADGAAGLMALKQAGGLTVVQDPQEAAFPSMPLSAIRCSRPDHIVGLSRLPGLLAELAGREAGPPVETPESLRYDVEDAAGRRGSASSMDRLANRSVFACPHCHGVMWEVDEGGVLGYRCHVGHAYTAQMLALMLREELHRALGSAVRALEERIMLARKLEQEARDGNFAASARSWSRKLADLEEEAKTIRQAMDRMQQIAGHEALETPG